MAGGPDLEDEAARRFFRTIGLSSAQRRMQNLDQQADKMRFRSRRQGSAGLAAQPKRTTNLFGSTSSPRHSVDMGSILPAVDDGTQQLIEQAAVPKASRQELALPSPMGSSGHGNDGQGRGKPLVGERQARMRDELDEAKRELKVRVQKYREELVEDMRSHEVSLLSRPTTAELEEPRTAHLQSLRRRHHKVVVGADEKEIRKMPNHKLCISDDLKRSLSKMRENLFQRRLNLAIYQKTVGDWAIPQLRTEVRRRGRTAAAASTKAQEQQRKPEAAPAAVPSVQVPGHAELVGPISADLVSPTSTVAPAVSASLAASAVLPAGPSPSNEEIMSA